MLKRTCLLSSEQLLFDFRPSVTLTISTVYLVWCSSERLKEQFTQILLLFTNPHVVPNPCDFLFSVEHKRWVLKEYSATPSKYWKWIRAGAVKLQNDKSTTIKYYQDGSNNSYVLDLLKSQDNFDFIRIIDTFFFFLDQTINVNINIGLNAIFISIISV